MACINFSPGYLTNSVPDLIIFFLGEGFKTLILILEDAAEEEMGSTKDYNALAAAADAAKLDARSAAAATSARFKLISGGAAAITTSSSGLAASAGFCSYSNGCFLPSSWTAT